MDFSALGYMDIFFLIIVGVSTVIGLAYGFIATILSFLSWLVAFTTSYFGLKYAQPYMEEYIKNPFGAQIVTFITLFLLSFIIMAIINAQILRVSRHMRMGILDKGLGAALGFVRGSAVVVIFVFVVLLVNSMLIGQDQKEKHEGVDRNHTQDQIKKDQVKKNTEVEPVWLKKSQGYQVARNVIVVILQQAKDYPPMLKLLGMLEGNANLMGSIDISGVDEDKIVKQAALLLDPSIQERIAGKYRSTDPTMKEIQHLQLSMDILIAYKKSVEMGVIPKAKLLKDEEVSTAILKLSNNIKLLQLEEKQKEIMGN